MQHIFCLPVFCLSLRDLIDMQDAKDILPRMNKHYKIYPTDERNTRADSIFLKPSVLSLLFLKSADSLLPCRSGAPISPVNYPRLKSRACENESGVD